LKGFGDVYRRGEVDAALFVVFGEAYSEEYCKGGHGVVVGVGVSDMDGKGEGEGRESSCLNIIGYIYSS
jgi:hypothetical protein